MRTAIFTFAGEPVERDLLLLSCRSARGGQSTVKCVIVDASREKFADPEFIPFTAIRRNFAPARDLKHAVEVLAAEINGGSSEWSPGAGDFRAVPNGLRLTVMASTLMNDVSFHFDQEGSGEVTCDIEVIG